MQLGAIEALGMLKDPIAVPRLSDFLRGEPSDVAEAAADALTSIGTPAALLAVKTWPKVKNRGA
jgi:HEAT repeat protein